MRFNVSTVLHSYDSYSPVFLTAHQNSSYNMAYVALLTGSMLCFRVFLRVYLASDSKFDGVSPGRIIYHVTQGYGSNST